MDDRGKLLTVTMAQHFAITNKIGKVLFVALIAKNSKVVLQNGKAVIEQIERVAVLLKKRIFSFTLLP